MPDTRGRQSEGVRLQGVPCPGTPLYRTPAQPVPTPVLARAAQVPLPPREGYQPGLGYGLGQSVLVYDSYLNSTRLRLV